MMIVSVLLYIVRLICCRVCGRVYVGCRLMRNDDVGVDDGGVVFLFMLILSISFFSASAVIFLKLLSW